MSGIRAYAVSSNLYDRAESIRFDRPHPIGMVEDGRSARKQHRRDWQHFAWDSPSSNVRHSSTSAAAAEEDAAMYEVRIDDDEPTVVNVTSLFEAWAESIPDAAARVLEMRPGEAATLVSAPRIVVRRLS